MKKFIVSFMLVVIALAMPAFGQDADEVEQLLGPTVTTTTIPVATTTTTVINEPAAEEAQPEAPQQESG